MACMKCRAVVRELEKMDANFETGTPRYRHLKRFAARCDCYKPETTRKRHKRRLKPEK